MQNCIPTLNQNSRIRLIIIFCWQLWINKMMKIRVWLFRGNEEVRFQFQGPNFLLPSFPWIPRSSEDHCAIWLLIHRPFGWLLHNCSNHQHKQQCKEHMRISSTWCPWCNSRRQVLIHLVYSQCREERRGSSSRHCKREKQVHRLQWNAIDRCNWQRCKHTLRSSSTDSIFWRSRPYQLITNTNYSLYFMPHQQIHQVLK